MIRVILFVSFLLHPIVGHAAGDVFFSLGNTNFIVLLSFLLFIGVLLYLKVPSLVTGMLDKRADSIKLELEEAKSLREAAQSILAGYERKQHEITEQAERIIESAKRDAHAVSVQAEADLELSIQRRLQAAEDQIAAAESSAINEIRETAISVAISAASEAIWLHTSTEDQANLINKAIVEVGGKIN
jgi:F-type H+-transporting ATPase subunit b